HDRVPPQSRVDAEVAPESRRGDEGAGELWSGCVFRCRRCASSFEPGPHSPSKRCVLSNSPAPDKSCQQIKSDHPGRLNCQPLPKLISRDAAQINPNRKKKLI